MIYVFVRGVKNQFEYIKIKKLEKRKKVKGRQILINLKKKKKNEK